MLGLAHRGHRVCQKKKKYLYFTEPLNDKSGQKHACGDLGSVCARFGEYELAIDYSRRALKMAQELGNTNRQYVTLAADLPEPGVRIHRITLTFIFKKRKKLSRAKATCP